MDKKSKTLLIVLIAIFLSSVAYTYVKTVVQERFEVEIPEETALE